MYPLHSTPARMIVHCSSSYKVSTVEKIKLHLNKKFNIFSSDQEATEPIEGAHGLREDFLERMMACPVKGSHADENGGTPETGLP